MSTVPARKRAKQPQTFRITLHIGTDLYGVVPLTPHPEVAAKAYRLHKHTGGREVYDVRLTPDGHAECDCPGFQRWAHRGTLCKHVRCLVAAGMLPRSAVQPAAEAAAVA